jgi:flagellin
MIGGINYASSQIASIYNTGNQQLANTLTRLASGKKFQSASDDLVGYLRAQNMQGDISAYDQVRENLTNFKASTTAAVQAGTSIYENLKEMENLASQYVAEAAGGNDADLLAQYKAEFNSLKTQAATTLANTYVDGILVTDKDVATSPSVSLGPDGGTLTMTFTAEAAVAALDITAVAAVTDTQTQVTAAMTYMYEAKSYDSIADQQLKLTDTIINSKKAVMSLITDINEAEELNNATDQSIRQQAAMSMLAQANMSREGILKLYM